MRVTVKSTPAPTTTGVVNELNYYNYFAFGSYAPNRTFEAGTPYSFGFNGQEKKDDYLGPGNSVDFKFRGYDTRIGRFTSIDPLTRKYPWNSPYAFAENRVIDGKDLEGREFSPASKEYGRDNTAVLKMMNPIKLNKIYEEKYKTVTSIDPFGRTSEPLIQDHLIEKDCADHAYQKQIVKQTVEITKYRTPDLSQSIMR